MQEISVPDYYSKFHCIGPDCEDSCCSGWTVSIDRDTYHKYKQNRHKVLAPLFKLAVSKNTSPNADNKNNFGLMKMKPDGACHFQQEDKLCAIQNTLGAQALSHTCMVYPRYFNQFGTMAPLAGVDDRPLTFYRFPLRNDGDPAQIAVLNDFRAVIIAILQFREISLSARVMLLGFLLEDANQIVSSGQFAHASELSPTLAAFAGMLSHPAQLETQFAQIQPNIPRKLEIMTQLISNSLMVGASLRFRECLWSAARGGC